MKLSSKGRYGLRALFHMAYHSGGRPTLLREIAAHEKIPARFLEQIFHELKRAGIVAAKRGPAGGYLLARHPAEVTFGDVIRALEGTTLVMDRKGARDAADPIDGALRELSVRIEQCFDGVTLAELCRRSEKSGLVRRRKVEGSGSADASDYAI